MFINMPGTQQYHLALKDDTVRSNCFPLKVAKIRVQNANAPNSISVDHYQLLKGNERYVSCFTGLT